MTEEIISRGHPRARTGLSVVRPGGSRQVVRGKTAAFSPKTFRLLSTIGLDIRGSGIHGVLPVRTVEDNGGNLLPLIQDYLLGRHLIFSHCQG